MAIVTFDPTAFRAAFPDDFPESVYSDAYLVSCFNRATVQINNTECAKIPYDRRGMILDLAVAHLAWMGKNRPAGLSGQISGATQGTTNVTTTVAAAPYTEQWWLLTSYGAECWMACAPYRSFTWVSP